MTIKEFYQEAEGNYDEVISALPSEKIILKYLNKFKDANVAMKIRTALDAKDYETAFRESHSLKGMCLNMYLTKTLERIEGLVESLRYGPKGDVEGFYSAAAAEYERICNLISQIQ